jgi:hypothetical protein
MYGLDNFETQILDTNITFVSNFHNLTNKPSYISLFQK